MSDKYVEALRISIHAPRVGSDPMSTMKDIAILNFNPRSPCGERPLILPILKLPIQFQSTLPVWGATGRTKLTSTARIFQSTLPVWGATAKMHRFFFCIFGKKGVFL